MNTDETPIDSTFVSTDETVLSQTRTAQIPSAPERDLISGDDFRSSTVQAKAQEYVDYVSAVKRERLLSGAIGHLESVCRRRVRRVVVILSSSRGGGSFLFEVLRNHPAMLSPAGEHVPYYKLHRLGVPFDGYVSDEVSTLDRISTSLLDDFFLDLVGEVRMGPPGEPACDPQWSDAAAFRFALQWPSLGVSYGELRHRLDELLRQQHSCFDVVLALARGFRAASIHRTHPHEGYYDCSGRRAFTLDLDAAAPEGPPNAWFCIEEPPFIVVAPRRPPQAEDFADKPLLLKAPVDVYRLRLLRELFPNAEFKYIHLVRNPASCINGLIDGWQHWGFFSHNISGLNQLSIGGYSDVVPWGRSWWNFDLPPGWYNVIDQPIEHVCAFQWYSAHKAIVDGVCADKPNAIFRLPFERILQGERTLRDSLVEVCRFIGVPYDFSLDAAARGTRVIMATTRPVPRRWLDRRDRIWPVVEQDHIKELCAHLGYRMNQPDEWL